MCGRGGSQDCVLLTLKSTSSQAQVGVLAGLISRPGTSFSFVLALVEHTVELSG